MATAIKVFRADDRSGEFSLSRSGASASEVVTYSVQMSDRNFTTAEAADADAGAAGAVPPYGHMIGFLQLLDKSVKVHGPPGDPAWADVVCKYSLPQPGQGLPPEDADNDRWNVTITFQSQPYEVEIQHDIEGCPIQSSAYDPIIITAQQSDEEIIIGFDTDTPDWDGIDAAYGELGRGCVNSGLGTLTLNGTPRVFQPGTLRFLSHSASVQAEITGVAVTHMEFRLLWRNIGWKRQLADKGLHRLTTADDVGEYPDLEVGVPVAIMEDVLSTDSTTGMPTSSKLPISNPQYLDGAGNPLVEGDDVVILGPGGEGVPIYEEVELFSALLWDLNT